MPLQPLIARLRALQIDAIVITPGANMRYFSGFDHGHAYERLLALVVRADGQSAWVAPLMNAPQIKPHLLPGQTLLAWDDHEGYLTALSKALGPSRTVAFDDDARAAFPLDLLALRPDTLLRKGSDITRPLRIRKRAGEIAALKLAGSTVDQVIPHAVALCKPGVRECDIDDALRKLLLAKSPQSAVAFTIIASGPNAALPHHETGSRILQQGDIVILDYGTREPGGYLSDITVTCSVGEPADPEARKVYQTVFNAQQAAINAVKPGATCHDIDQAARKVIEDAGYGPYFIHRTGHGLGLQGHEPPYLVNGIKEKLEEGMVFSIEPGIYLPGRFGVRLELIVAVGESGPLLLNHNSAAELPIIG